jgi:hypothetical protein
MAARGNHVSGANDWREYYDAEHGMPYYHSESRRLTTWTLPVGCTAQPASGPRHGRRPAVQSKHVVDRRGDWCQVVDTLTGDAYFVHRRTKATRWQEPEDWNTRTPDSPASEDVSPDVTVLEHVKGDVGEVKSEEVESLVAVSQNVSLRVTPPLFPAVSELPPPPGSDWCRYFALKCPVLVKSSQGYAVHQAVSVVEGRAGLHRTSCAT